MVKTHANTYIHRHTHTHAHAPVRIPEGISCGTRGWSTQDHKKKSLLFHMNPGFLLYVQIQLEGLEEKTFPCWHLTHLQSLTLRHPNMHATVWDRDEPNKYFPAISPYKKKKNDQVLYLHTASADPSWPGDPVSDWPGFNLLCLSSFLCFSEHGRDAREHTC